MLNFFILLFGTARAAFRSHADLVVENLALRQQLAAYTSGGRRPRVATADRWLWIALHQFWSRWAEVLVFVKPETVIRWHRDGFRRYWARLSRRGRKLGRPPIGRELRRLIRRIALENLTWGAPRIHGELRMLGFNVSERTISRYLPRRPPQPDAVQRWITFLRNHCDAIAAMDFFIVPTATFRVLYVWFAIEHARRRVVHFDITDHPHSAWVIQQLREAFPFDTAPRHLIFDRDSIFSADVVSTLKSFGIAPARTSYRSPWQNGIAERWVGNVRRELLDHVVVLGEGHLHRLLAEYIAHYHDDRTHLGLGKETPTARQRQHRPEGDAHVVSLPRVGGLHHRYEWRAAA